MIRRFAAVLLLVGLSFAPVHAAEYFVCVDGYDANDGLSRGAAFATVQRGVDALDPGDTLTIAPGEYFGAVRRENLGGLDAVTTIRAEIPGTVVLRGDVPAPEFRKVEGYRFVYAAEFDGEPQVVNELDTQRVFEHQPSIALLEFIPGAFHYDRSAGKLYISTSDLTAPGGRRYTVSVLPTHGIHLREARRVVIEGIAVTGFNTASLIDRRDGSFNGAWGMFLFDATECVIRDCRAWLNGQGIGSNSTAPDAGGNVIERCVAWANASQFGTGDRGALTLFFPHRDTIRDSIAYNNDHLGINMYGAARGTTPDEDKSLLSSNIAWGNRPADVKIKGGGGYLRITERNVGLGLWSLNDPQHCLAGVFTRDCADNNIMLNQEDPFDPKAEFADPENLDYRLQASSRFRGAAEDGSDRGPFPYEENIFYLSENGDDSADGLSVASAWQSLGRALRGLGPGDTLYLESGVYEADGAATLNGSADRPVFVRGRGRGAVVIAGSLELRGSRAVRFERINFAETLGVRDSRDVRFENCRFAGAETGLATESVEGMRVAQSEFSGFSRFALDLTEAADVFLQGNIFANRNGAAIRTDQADSVRHSDYNAFANADTAWQVGGQALGLPQAREAGQERFSKAIVPEFTQAGGAPTLANPGAFATHGPFGGSPGIHHRLPDTADDLRISGPFVHSVTDTTANIEWQASGPCAIRIDWGETPAMENTVALDAHRFGSFSLTGLRPGTPYYARLSPDPEVELRSMEGFAAALRYRNLCQTLERDLDFLTPEDAVQVTDESIVIRFATAPAPEESQVYYVATDGDDASSGLSREQAWRTVQHAANRARPGDTVLIAGGTYVESVRVRATGDEGRPITFKAMPGEKVVFDGAGRTLDCAFYLNNKAWLSFDGFYFTGFSHLSPNMPWSDIARGNNSVFVLYRSDDVRITRCFHDGRGFGTSPGLAQAVFSSNLLLRNNAVIRSMGGGIAFVGCPELRVENNVFLRSEISHVGDGVNEPGQKFYLLNNVFTDNLPKKVFAPLFDVGKIESLVERDNGYYLRLPEDERRVFMFYVPYPACGRPARAWGLATEFDEPSVITERALLTLPEYQRLYNPDSASVAADPHFRGTQDMDRVDADGKRVDYLVDRLMTKPDMDFPDLFATNPELVERGIGLQPEAFEDFHFNRE